MKKFILDNSFAVPGVYIIKCIQTNYHYIGSSKNTLKRIKYHEMQLKKGMHTNIKMQQDYNNGYDFKIDLLYTFENNEPQNIRIAIEYGYILEMYKRHLSLYNYEVYQDHVETTIKNQICGRVITPYDISFNCGYYNLINNKKRE